MKLLMLLILIPSSLLLGCREVGGSEAEIVASKAIVSLRHWEYSPTEFQQTIKLSESEQARLASLFGTRQDGDGELRGLAVLAALNCVDVADVSGVRWLYGYLCSDVQFDQFVEKAIQSMDSMYMLSFVKESDRSRTLDFLRSYIDLLKAKAHIAAEDLEYLEEIYMHVESNE